MEQLVEDYKRRLKTINTLIDDMLGMDMLGMDMGVNIVYEQRKVRLSEKASCFRTFISELDREIAKQKETNY